MTKKTLSILLITLLAALALTLHLTGKGQGSADSFILDQAAADTIMSERAQAKELSPDIYFDEQKLVFDSTAETFYYSLVEDSDTAYSPDIRATLGTDNAKVYFIGTGIFDELISTNTPIKILIASEKSYRLCNLICTTLPVMNIETKPTIGEEDQEMKLMLFDNEKDSVKRRTESQGYIRIRGGMSRAFPKNSFKLTLQKESVGHSKRKDKLSLLGMRQDEDWILNSLYNDYEKVRNTLNHNLWTETVGTDNAYNIDTGIYYKYVELFVNGEYWGLYTLGYLPDEKTLNSRALTDNEGLYKKRIYKVSGYRTDDYPFDPVYEYYTKVEEADHDPAALKELIDMDNAIDFSLYTTMTQGIDNLEHNYYLLVRDLDGQQKGIFVPWDLDLTYGSEWTVDDPNHTSCYSFKEDQNLLFTDSPLYQLLAEEDEETYNQLFEKYRILRQNGWSDENIGKKIDEYEKDIFGSGAYYRDQTRWPEGNYIDGITSLDTFRKYVTGRLFYMDAYMERLENNRTDNQFINQCIKYVDLEKAVFVLELKNKKLVNDPEYREFLEYIGIDPDRIIDTTGYIVTSFGGKNAEYIDSSFTAGESYETEMGELALVHEETADYDHDEDYTVFLGNTKCFESSPIVEQPILAATVIGDVGDELYMKSEYKVESDFDAIPNTDIWFRFLDNIDGKVLLQLNHKDGVTFDRDKFLSEFNLDLAGYETVQDALEGEDKLLFLLDCTNQKGYLIRNPYVSGTYVETPIGSYAYYEGEDSYGIYINGEDHGSGNVGEAWENAVDISVYSENWTEGKYHYADG
ncbi:CotH kinase family protein [Butyrivibrio sp. AE2032]|uniref:CotH kinase family protein n=1 Tax=Butyrivibrio sp. AE2032 TaxID=1458463 RepID=UPI000557BCE4|nr:CotH kinase family protein [Butyrivibrio sp. AE2032]